MSEYLDIGLGKYAPFVFEKMLGLNRSDRIEQFETLNECGWTRR